MKKIFCLIAILLVSSCINNAKDDPLIVPPNFAEVPDVNHPEQPTNEQKEESVAKLKELLLKSDE
ncbi:MAG: hypothetical protein V4694_00470 [Pseudomonadota bacterium]